MIKFETFFAPKFGRIFRNFFKFYSTPVGKVNPMQLNDGTKSQNDSGPVAINAPSQPVSSKSENKNCGAKPRGEGRGKNCDYQQMVPKDPGPPGGKYIVDQCDVYDIPRPNSKKWKTISFIVLPLVAGFSAYVLGGDKEHPKREYIPYEHMYKRDKRFAWGEGQKSLFHGPNNFVPGEQKAKSDGN